MLRLAIPVVTIQVGMMTMGVVDTIMVGHISPRALAAVALGNLYFFALAVFGMGTLMVLDPVVAQAVGARDRPAIASAAFSWQRCSQSQLPFCYWLGHRCSSSRINPPK
jgi:Na+-driven multidrug efflux pump